jgi:enamine deaminase RidA (YjgF/YER057c/UK114 family)
VGVIEERLAQLGLDLPAVFAGPPGVAVQFDLVRVAGDVAYISGHGPTDGPRVLMKGKVGDHLVGDWLSQEAGWETARLTALAMLASLKAELGDLDRVSGWLRVLGFVNAAPGFNGTPAVSNGFSNLILELWGDSGHHSRSAIGVAELPFDMPVEVEAVVAVR